MYKIAVIEKIHEDGLKIFSQNPNYEYELIENTSKENLIKELPKFDGCTLRVSELNSEVLSHCKKLKVISIVTLQGMVEDQPDMTEYTQMSFYDTRKLEDNPDWYAEDTILNAYGRSIYQDKTLIAYQTNDPVFQHTESINRVNETIGRLEAELEVLKNELNE